MFAILVIICAIFVWITYHKIFNVIFYLDFGKACLGEILVSIFGGIILAYLIVRYWFIAVPIIIFLIYKMVK